MYLTYQSILKSCNQSSNEKRLVNNLSILTERLKNIPSVYYFFLKSFTKLKSSKVLAKSQMKLNHLFLTRW